MRLIAVFLSVILFSGCSEAQVEKKQNQAGVIKNVQESEFKELMEREGTQLIDVRTPEEFSEGKIDDAKNIDYYSADFKEQMAKLDKTKPVLLYCRSGARSGKSAEILSEMGFMEIYNLEGGYLGWPNK